MTTGDKTAVDEALDNDIVLKAVRYGLIGAFWPEGIRVGVLGAARFVVRDRIKRAKLADLRPEIDEELTSFIDRVTVLEPSQDEVLRAAELEREAQQKLLPIDAGESQLAAIVVARAIALMSTGDKRAIASFEQLLEAVPWLTELGGRVRCLEQIVLDLVRHASLVEMLSTAICSDPCADKTLAICFSCHSGGSVSADSIEQGLLSYIGALRSDAPYVLVPEP